MRKIGGVLQSPSMAKATTLKEVGEQLTFVVQHMATKDEVRKIVADEVKHLATKEDTRRIEREVKSIRDDLEVLDKKVQNVIGYGKEIDHALERIAAIEKHLGLNKKIA